jgi:DNA repair protein RadD
MSAVLQPQAFIPRPYQREAVDASVRFLKSKSDKHGIVIAPTGCGKSLIIANIVAELDGPCLVFQPSKEILRQNFQKLVGYGFRPGVYSASLGKKQISGAVTLATIGSVAKRPELFERIKYVLADECHLISSISGMYKNFFASLEHRGFRIVGLTATPYRLASNSFGTELRFLTRTRPRLFSEVVYYIQNRQLFEEGYLAKLQYHKIEGFDRSRLLSNSTGADYTDASVQAHFRETNFAAKTERVVRKLMDLGRRGILVFTRFVAESEHLARQIPGVAVVSAETPAVQRDQILRDFKSGKIQVVSNAAVLVVGFDYPELDTVVLASPTMSLARYYQEVGRVIRPHPSKDFAMVVDMVGLTDQFGKVEDLHIEKSGKAKWFVSSNGKQLTNTYLTGRG